LRKYSRKVCNYSKTSNTVLTIGFEAADAESCNYYHDARTGRTTTIWRTTVWEACISRHHDGALKPTEHHGTIVSRDLMEVLNRVSIMPRGISLSYDWCDFSQSEFFFSQSEKKTWDDCFFYWVQEGNRAIPNGTALFDWALERFTPLGIMGPQLMALKLLGTIVLWCTVVSFSGSQLATNRAWGLPRHESNVNYHCYQLVIIVISWLIWFSSCIPDRWEFSEVLW